MSTSSMICDADVPTLIALPTEMLQHVATFLDKESLYSFACAHPRLRRISENLISLEEIKSKIVSDTTIRFFSPCASTVRCLDLTNCWSASDRLRALIERCTSLTELSIVNTPLRAEDLVNSLRHLVQLENLSFTIFDPPKNPIRLEPFPRIQKIYLEANIALDGIAFAVRFLEACEGAKEVRVKKIGDTVYSNPTLWSGSGCMLQHLIGQNMQLLTRRITTVMIRNFSRHRQDIFHFHRWDRVLEGQEPVDDTEGHKYQLLDLDQGFPDVYNAAQVGLKVSAPFLSRGLRLQMPSMGTLSRLKELNFLDCRRVYSAQSWQSLVDSCPAVEALALPGSSLFSSEGRFLTEMDDRIIHALQKLKLKKLFIGPIEEEFAEASEGLSGRFTRYLSGFKYLEELIMDQISVSEDFFGSVKGFLSVKTLKFRFDSPIASEGLAEFLKACRDLRNLKIDCTDLPLHMPGLWDTFADCKRLEQLCLSSDMDWTIDEGMLRSRLAELSKSLDVFHLHVKLASNVQMVERLLRELAQTTTLRTKPDPVKIAGAFSSYTSGFERALTSHTFPGRNLCHLGTFIATTKPVGWDMD